LDKLIIFLLLILIYFSLSLFFVFFLLDEPFKLVEDDLCNIWTCLGIFDPVAKKGNAASSNTNTGGFRHNNAAVKFNSS
jgi:hypothetical protein